LAASFELRARALGAAAVIVVVGGGTRRAIADIKVDTPAEEKPVYVVLASKASKAIFIGVAVTLP